MATHTTDIVLVAGEPLSGVWTLTHDDLTPVEPELVTCAVFQAPPGAEPLRDWSAYAAGASGSATLDVPGPATGELAAGQWTIQLWVTEDADAVPDAIFAQINARVYVGHADPTAELEVSGAVIS